MKKHCESAKRFGKKGTAAMTRRLEDFIRDSNGWAFEAAYKLAGNREDAKELVQEAMFRVVKAWDRFDGSRPLEAWFLTVLRNLYFDLQSRYERKHGLSLDAERGNEDERSFHDMIAGNDEELDAGLRREDDERLVRTALSRLTRAHRAMLKACDLDGLDYDAAAARLGLPLGTVRSRLSRARTAFRRAVGEVAQGGIMA